MSLSAEEQKTTSEEPPETEDTDLTKNADKENANAAQTASGEKETAEVVDGGLKTEEAAVTKEDDETGDDLENQNAEAEEKTEKEETIPGQINIDLGLMKNLYQFRSRPTLPYLLTEYGMEDKDAPLTKSKQKGKDKTKKKEKSFGDDSGRDKEKDLIQEEKHLEIVRDMTRLRNFYYDEYTTLLQTKVEKQRSKIRQHDQAMQKKLAEREEKAKQESHQLKPRLERHEFVSDSSFLLDIPKSDMYYMVQLQDQLIKDGTLKSQSDLSNFWERIQEPNIFYMYFKVPKSDVFASLKTWTDFTRMAQLDYNESASMTGSHATSTVRGSSTKSKGSRGNASPTHTSGKKEGLGPRALSRIAESRENSRPGTRLGHQHWAVTQQFTTQHRERRRSSFTGLTKPAQTSNKSSYLQELEKRFPKLEMPKLHCFTMSLGPKPPDVDQVRHQLHLQTLEKARKKHGHKLTRMHQLAMANAAAASRILEMHEDMDFILNGAALPDLISDQQFYSGMRLRTGPSCSSPLDDRQAASHTFLTSVTEQEELCLQSPAPLSSALQSRKSSGSRKSKKSKASPKPPSDSQPPTPVIPLSLDEVVNKGRILEAKCMSTMWTNYTKEGMPAPVQT